MKIRIDTYFDLTCDNCSRSWSTDFDCRIQKMDPNGGGGMGMATDKQWLRKQANSHGWKNRAGKTLCPECLKKIGGR